jgi:hypothetical protein
LKVGIQLNRIDMTMSISKRMFCDPFEEAAGYDALCGRSLTQENANAFLSPP